MNEVKTPTAIEPKHNDPIIKIGRYRHYKGDLYEVIGVGFHSETMEELVFYRCLHYTREFGNGALWVRPLAMFLEPMQVNGETVERFKFVEDAQ